MSSTIASPVAAPIPADRVRVETIRAFGGGDPLVLECGAELPEVDVRVETYGELDPSGANAVLVCHALTGDAHAATHAVRAPGEPDSGPEPRPGWWAGAIGPGRPLDPASHFVVCTNILGSCYGTTGPASRDPRSGRRYGKAFPPVTVRDMVAVQRRVLDVLGVRRLALAIGGSLGGMQVLEWALLHPERVDAVAPIATAARHSAWAIALGELSRLAIVGDPAWRDGDYEEQPARGLALARMVAMVTYRHSDDFGRRFGRETADGGGKRFDDPFGDGSSSFQVERYLRYQGRKLVDRFDANAYLCLSRAMDAHDVGRGRGPVEEVLGSIRVPALCVGIDSDLLYPAAEQRELCRAIPGAIYREIRSIKGHDGFLVEHGQLGEILDEFLAHAGVG